MVTYLRLTGQALKSIRSNVQIVNDDFAHSLESVPKRSGLKIRGPAPAVNHQARLAGVAEMGRHTLALDLADEAATTWARLAGLAASRMDVLVLESKSSLLATPVAPVD